MSALLCCESLKPYKALRTDHEVRFTRFMAWANDFQRTVIEEASKIDGTNRIPLYAIQLVRQVNYGPLESKRYFVNFADCTHSYVEVAGDFLIQVNFQKINSFKNFKCDIHDRFFEINLYQKDPINKHHWRANLARPASNIDL
ncbi:unnamed protein product [Colletotrichum noveboracense]|uniref:Uncharacterized protein n=1 Tax=Colletotrichum noveboracense TaxID=2664923 RepID=A0A9W4S206_9PEZI|nr:hypothetical protein K456DRAFT_1829233 [Colletotrichum gloeosporioides 23]KAJ0268203.1 hypothetical protein COL940_013607 [Colletotrichum noveboracense]KAJ0314088.1 hypothetical protein Brms1b_007239 [Colletotrichum noveboracense]CAI0651515.1 unnamed protein product [Colletotrichum noveboracense]